MEGHGNRVTRSQTQMANLEKDAKRRKGATQQESVFERSESDNVIRPQDIITCEGKIKVEQHVEVKQEIYADSGEDILSSARLEHDNYSLMEVIVKEEIDLGDFKEEPILVENSNLFTAFFRIFCEWCCAQDKAVNTFNITKRTTTERSAALKCRLICRAWKIEVDQILDEGSNNDEPFYCYRFSADELDKSIKAFQQHFDVTHLYARVNPFVVRKVTILATEGWEKNNLEGVCEFLRKYGEHIWNCKLEKLEADYQLVPSTFNCYRWVEQCLALMPNLLELCISGWFDERNNWQWVDYANMNPLPKVKCLKRLKIYCFLPAPILNELLHRNEMIAELEFSPWNIPSKPLPLLFDNLKQLSVFFESNIYFRNFMYLQVLWKLTNLYLDLSKTNIETEIVLQFLNKKFAEYLQKLTLELPMSTSTDVKLNLNQLESLNIHYVGSRESFNLDFALPMKNTLRDISVDRTPEEHKTGQCDDDDDIKHFHDGEEGCIKPILCMQDLHQSNLWVLLPFLETVTYLGFTCTRNQWERRKSKIAKDNIAIAYGSPAIIIV